MLTVIADPTLMANFSSDIPENVARAAHRGTSRDPETCGRQEIANYAQLLFAAHEALRAASAGREARFAEEFARYRAGFRRHYLAMLDAKSRCVSTAVVGPIVATATYARQTQGRADRCEFKMRAYYSRGLDRARDALRKKDA